MKITNKDDINFDDARVKKRIAKVQTWCKFHLSTDRPTRIHNSVLTSVFGPSGNKLSKFLRANLLLQSGTYKPGEFSYEYTLKKETIGQPPPSSSIVYGEYIPKNQDEGTGTHTHPSSIVYGEYIPNEEENLSSSNGEYKFHSDLESNTFTYNLKSDRYWHPLQNIKRERKTEFWQTFGLPYDYDIEACAPTVLLQLASRFGMLNLLSEPIRKYLRNKDTFRQHVSTVTGCSLSTAKRLVNSLFNGARLARNNYCSAYRALDCDYIAMTKLQMDPEVTELRNAIKQMWNHIQSHTELSLKTSKAKWAVYFKFERAINEAIQQELTKQDIRHFMEHDGFRTDRQIDKVALQEAILKSSSFAVKLAGPNKED